MRVTPTARMPATRMRLYHECWSFGRKMTKRMYRPTVTQNMAMMTDRKTVYQLLVTRGTELIETWPM